MSDVKLSPNEQIEDLQITITMLEGIGKRLQDERNKLAGNLTLAEAKLNLIRAERDMLAAELRLVKLQLKEAKGE